MHWMNREQIEKINKKLVLTRLEDLGLDEFEVRIGLEDGDTSVNVWDPKHSGMAFVSINVSTGRIDELDTGAREGDFIYELDDYSPRIAALASIERELQV